MKLPCRSVDAYLIVFAPSRINDTSAPASGLPLLSRTVPVIVASDLFELAAGALLEINDSNAITDKLRRNILLMRDLRDQSPFGSRGQANWLRRGRLTWNRQTGLHFRPRHHGCQVITPYFRPKTPPPSRPLPPLLGRATIPHPLCHRSE